MNKRVNYILLFAFCGILYSCFPDKKNISEKNPVVYSKNIERTVISPARIVWLSDSSNVINANLLLNKRNSQADLFNNTFCKLVNRNGKQTSILVDYGKELHGGLQIVTGRWETTSPLNIRVRFGESVSEAMSELGGEKNATNDHAIRDWKLKVPWLGSVEIGNTGFRFVRIDFLDEDAELLIKELNAIFVLRDIPYLGSFKSNDERLNKIWETGAYTVHLNMQEYLWDGIKRDRLVWVGDMYPEVKTILSVFGCNELIPKSLDLIKEKTPLPQWMNGISSYSMWWLLIQYQWYLNSGDWEYLNSQSEYIFGLLEQMEEYIDENGCEKLNGNRFLDWPTSEDETAIHAGLQSMMVMSFTAGNKIATELGKADKAQHYTNIVNKLIMCKPDSASRKAAGALMALSGLEDPVEINEKLLSINQLNDISTFYGYYVLDAMALAGNYDGALNIIRNYWGAMLDLGATTFWEDFDIKWTKNAACIDEMLPEGKTDVHATYGNYCYKGLRHSLCHGWASGPTAWLSEYVLGVKVLEPGCTKVKIEPHLGNLQWVEGNYPTPFGVIKIRHEKRNDGTINSKITAPKGIVWEYND